mmetsp:Transcript_22496/g.32919  ORF Transcript_22496/g.32919 Transcript_22496/m.32919 type:complete len:131 (+) Transcript_22496:398-790(+)
MWGVVKETGVDDEGLVDFYSNSFSYPLYRDEDLVFYNDFFGGSKLGLTTYNPLRLYRGYKRMNERLNEKGLEGNLKGEGIVQGGIIIIGKDGRAKFAYREETGKEVPLDDILAAIRSVKQGDGDSTGKEL